MIHCDDRQCRIDGVITVENAASILGELKPHIVNKLSELDFSGVTRVDSSGLALMLSCKREAQKQNSLLRLTGLSDSVAILAELYGITPLLQA